MREAELSDALRAVVAEIPQRVPVERLDRIWIFPPKEIGSRESGLVVLALLPAEGGGADVRSVLTLQYESDRGRPRPVPRVVVTDQGSAPPERVPRVIAGVVARLTGSDEPAEHRVRGDRGAWRSLLARYGIPVVDRDKGE